MLLNADVRQAQFLTVLALADIGNGGKRERFAARRDRIEADFDRNLAGILTPPIKIASGTHRPRGRRCGEVIAQFGMPAPEALWNELIDRHTKQLVTRVAEE